MKILPPKVTLGKDFSRKGVASVDSVCQCKKCVVRHVLQLNAVSWPKVLVESSEALLSLEVLICEKSLQMPLAAG